MYKVSGPLRVLQVSCTVSLKPKHCPYKVTDPFGAGSDEAAWCQKLL